MIVEAGRVGSFRPSASRRDKERVPSAQTVQSSRVFDPVHTDPFVLHRLLFKKLSLLSFHPDT